MGNFNRDRRSGGGRFGGGRPAMHKAICADCGNECEVPFRPTGDKPVYCSDCFGAHKDSGSDRSGGRFGGRDRGFGGGRDRDRGDKQMFDAVCSKCGNACQVPFRPSGDKPVYCDACFGKGGGAKGTDQFKGQFENLNIKLDKILKLLNPAGEVKPEKVAKEVKEPAKAKKETKAPKKAKAKKK